MCTCFGAQHPLNPGVAVRGRCKSVRIAGACCACPMPPCVPIHLKDDTRFLSHPALSTVVVLMHAPWQYYCHALRSSTPPLQLLHLHSGLGFTVDVSC